MVAKKISKTDRIPKHNGPLRKSLNSILLELPEYKQKLNEGLPFFSKDELDDLNEKYKDGITWNEIEAELSKKSLILKKATFQKYIREQLISPAKGYKTYSKGRMAIFSSKIIEQINLVQYLYKATDSSKFTELLNLLNSWKINGLELVESKVVEFEGTDNIFSWFKNYLIGVESGTVEEVLLYPFQKTPDFAEDLSKEVKKLERAKEDVMDIFSRIIEKLKSYEVLYIADSGTEEENKNG